MDAVERLITDLAAPRPPGRPGRTAWRIAHALAKRALGYVELYGAYTETEARYRVDRLLELWAHLPTETGPASASTRASSTGLVTSTISTSRRWWPTPGCAWPRRARSWTSVRTGLGGPSCRPNATWPSSTSSTRSSPRTWWTPTPGSPAVICRWPSGRPSWRPGRRPPSLLALDRRDRGDFLRSFYRRYEDAPVAPEAKTPGSCSTVTCSPAPFPTGSARCASAGASAPDPPHHRRARLRDRAHPAALRRHRLCPTWCAPRRPLYRAPRGATADQQGPAPCSLPTTPPARACP